MVIGIASSRGELAGRLVFTWRVMPVVTGSC